MNYTITFHYGRPPIALSASVIADDLAHAIVAARQIADRGAISIGERGFGEVDLVRIDGTLYTPMEAVQLEKTRRWERALDADEGVTP